jgi:DNA-binding response OmpR family regulator
VIDAQCKSILIVEDDVDVRETLAEVLSEEGYDILAFAGGRAALEHLRSTTTRPGLILLDLMMPNMDGWEFREEQQRNDNLNDVPTVILSADGNVEQNMSSLRADGYLRKPIHIRTLLQLVESFCGLPEASKQMGPNS